MGFFDKLKEQASNLGGQLDSAMDSTKQKGQVNTMRKQRAELVAQLGESLLEQFRQQNVNAEQLRPEVDGIFSLERQIIETEKQMEAQMQAAAQAKAQQGPPAAPGPQVSSGPPPAPPAPPAPPQQSQATCPSCGGEIPEGSGFCPGCGNKS